MNIKTAVAALSALLVWGAVPLFAHHSFQSTFDIDKPVRLEGKVTQNSSPLCWPSRGDVVRVSGPGEG